MKNSLKNKTWLSIVLVIGLLAITFGTYQYVTAQNYERDINNQYTRSFYNFSESMQNVQASLEKGMLITNTAQMVKLSNEVNQKTQAAKTSLSQLPFEKTQIDQINKFLTQAGDFTYSLAMKLANDKKMDDDDYASMKELVKYCRILNDSIDEIQNEMSAGNVSVYKASTHFSSNIKTVDMSMEDLANQFVEYPSLVYDGPFSSHVDNMTPKMTENKPEITQEEAVSKAKWFLNSGDKPVEVSGEVGGNLPSYRLTCYPEGKDSSHVINLDVTKAGGFVVWYLDSRLPTDATADVNTAKRAALEFLANKGFGNVKDSYYEVQDNIATINYASVQDNTIIYPDLIKVKVALDNATILGMESKGYIMSHTDRIIPAPKVSQDEILAKLPKDIQVNNVTMSIIPREDLSEVYCYEVKGSVDERNFLIYFDAESGMETKILMLIESDTGILTM